MPRDIQDLLEKVSASGGNYNIELIQKAYDYARSMHEGQYRKSGEAYISHPVAVAEIVAALELDTESICAALLHDTLEDCSDKVKIEDIRSKFGAEIAVLVDGLTKLVSIPFEDKEEEHIENLRKMFLAMSKDIRVIFIKLCDRLHNMRTLSSHVEAKQRLIALETMHVYAPLAHRLGIQRIKSELEKLALLYLDPIGYNEVKQHIDAKYGANKNFLEKARGLVSDKLNGQGIKFVIEGRVKSIYSIYRKMYNQNKSFDEIYDFYAIRIIVEDELNCYTVLGLMHEMFYSMPGRFKDYISTPKPNLYKSIHTTVIGRDGIPFEVQIRTKEMHVTAEYGLAAHWKYKSGVNKDDAMAKRLEWIRMLLENEKDAASDSDEFLRPLKIDLFEDETFVFTPKGDVVNLPNGATAIDFAYSIHSAVGNKMIGVKVNGVIAPIDTVLQTGQIVEVLTSSSSKGPNRDWLKIVKSSEARNKIRQWYKKEKREENIAHAQNEVERILKKFSRPYTEEQQEEIVLNVARKHGINEIDDFYNAIGYGGITLSKIEPKLKSEFERLINPLPEVKPFANIIEVKKEKTLPATQSVIIEGIDNCHVKFAKCCNPLPGDHIVGFITKGFGISIHKYDCPNTVQGLNHPENKDRWLTASWAGKAAESYEPNFDAQLNIFAHNSMTLLADISAAIADMHVGILSINSRNIGNADDMLINIVIRTKSTEHFNSIVSRLKKVSNVLDVTRGRFS